MPQFFQFPKPAQPQGPVPLPPQEAPNRPIGQDWLSDAVDLILGGIGIENPLSPQASKATQIGGLVTAGLPILGAVKGASALKGGLVVGRPYTAKVSHATLAENAQSILDQGFDVARGKGLGGDHYGPGVYVADQARDLGSFWRNQLETMHESGTVPTQMLHGKAALEKALILDDMKPLGGGRYGTYTAADHVSKNLPAKADEFKALVSSGMRPNQALGKVARDAGYDGMVLERTAGDEVIAFSPTGVKFDRPENPALASLATAAPEPQGIKAYHGSPHDFDKFSLGKIGTGEGAQAYGHGLYFAENEAIAKSYRDTLSKGDALTVRLPGQKPLQGEAIDAIGLEAAKYLEYGARDAGQFKHNTGYYALKRAASAPEAVQARIKEWANAKIGYEPIKGSMFEVNIKADPSHFLDWDKPLKEQSEHVLAALRKAGVPVNDPTMTLKPGRRPGEYTTETGLSIYRDADGYHAWNERTGWGTPQAMSSPESAAQYAALNDPSLAPPGTGAGAYSRLAGRDEELRSMAGSMGDVASKQLRDAGIPGIKYLDGGSRSAGQGSSNFVVFDENIIDILKKYGILAPFAGAAAASQSQPLTPQKPSVY